MDSKEREFREKLLATFRVEAREHVDALTAGLITLEGTSDAEAQAGCCETLSREAHSLKGAARAVGEADMELVCQSLESVFVALKRRRVHPSPQLLDALHRAGDGLRRMLHEGETAPGRGSSASRLVAPLEALLKGGPAQAGDAASLPSSGKTAAAIAPSPAGEPGTVRVSTAKLEAVLRQAEELLAVRRASAQQAGELRDLQRQVSAWKRERGSLPPQGLDAIEAALARLANAAESSVQSMTAAVDSLLDDMKRVSLQPFSTILEVFPKLIRDLSRDQGKEAELVLRGTEIEVDRRVLEEIKDPLIHIARNCIDHGIETPEERRRKGKRPRGTITMAVSQRDGRTVELSVEDDGAGIDGAKVRAAAVRMGLLTREQAESIEDSAVLPLIFHSGLSTSPMITDVSGRGLGLAIAREKAEKLGGGLSVGPRPAGGTILRITLPTTASTFRGIIVATQGRHFAFPSSGVERVVRVNRADTRTVENRETITMDGRSVSLVELHEILGIPASAASTDSTEKQPAVVVAGADNRLAVLVDEVIGEQELLVKPLGSHVQGVRNIAGATVLETGEIVPVLLVPDLTASAALAGAAAPVRLVAAEEPARRKVSVLVVEDSITSRMLLKNILESAGYEVGVAVDGIDALTALRSGDFDVVVSDVQMPRMDGFDLTARIRADTKLGETPVVLVTALESREDKEHGIEVGANAYIVKSSFDQGNLLEAIERLV